MGENSDRDAEKDDPDDDDFVPLTEAEKEIMGAGKFSSGVETHEADIDDIIYQLEFEEG